MDIVSEPSDLRGLGSSGLPQPPPPPGLPSWSPWMPPPSTAALQPPPASASVTSRSCGPALAVGLTPGPDTRHPAQPGGDYPPRGDWGLGAERTWPTAPEPRLPPQDLCEAALLHRAAAKEGGRSAWGRWRGSERARGAGGREWGELRVATTPASPCMSVTPPQLCVVLNDGAPPQGRWARHFRSGAGAGGEAWA